MRVLVTGGAGFIGSHLCDLLVAQGHEVLSFDRLDEQVHGQPNQPGGRPSWPAYNKATEEREGLANWLGDVIDGQALHDALSRFKPDAVVHLAAQVGVGQSWVRSGIYAATNLVGTYTLFDVIRALKLKGAKVPEVVFLAGSMSSYGEGPGVVEVGRSAGRDLGGVVRGGDQPIPTGEGWPLAPQNPYALQKAQQEQAFLMLGQQLGLRTVVGRFFNVYGERQSLRNPYTGVAAIFAARILHDLAPVINDDGQQTRDFIHVSDVVNGIQAILERGESGEVYNVSTGRATSILRLADMLLQEAGARDLQPQITGEPRVGDIRHCIGDSQKLQALGWQPRVDLQVGIRELWRWVAEQPAEQVRELLERAFLEQAIHGLGGITEEQAAALSPPKLADIEEA